MWYRKVFLCSVYIVIVSKCVTTAGNSSSVWRWTCLEGKCVKTEIRSQDTQPPLSLESCKMFCNEFGLLWPSPTGHVNLGNYLSKVNINKIKVVLTKRGASSDFMDAASERFKSLLRNLIPSGVTPKATGKSMEINIVNGNPHLTAFSLTMDESYTLNVSAASNEKINVTIVGGTFFGVRHGLETLSQLFIYDDIRQHLLVAREVSIIDEPVYPYRGILLDTARNYYSVESIKSTINAMATVKLNTFHWHITDSHSFPFVSERRPELSRSGSYSPSKVYTKEAIREIVLYGLERGVRVMPEFDAPAHVGEGWQGTDLTVCFKAEPWTKYCVEPPCGQFNPIKDQLYEYLEDIYSDMKDYFNPDIFHMGGDEVSEKCWESSDEIQKFIVNKGWGSDESKGFFELWNYFQTNAQQKAHKVFGNSTPLIMWTSTLTKAQQIEKYLSRDDYIIQVWTKEDDPEILSLLKKGYRLIISNYDALYFDCGFGAWVGSGLNNWCSPYIGWQKVYNNSPAAMAKDYKNLILGGEAALWSEQSDSSTLDSRLWPRAAAMAERLWGEPKNYLQDAEKRMLHIRERLVGMGIKADVVQPEWCYQNEDSCVT